MGGTQENRRAARSKRDSVLELFDESGAVITGIGRLVNVSTEGMCFSSAIPFAQGDAVRARLRLLKEGQLDISGHIVWARRKTNTTLYGVAFDSVHAAEPR